MIWDRFTEKARAVVCAANEEAVRLGHREVTTQHLLRGLLRDAESVACHLLRRANVAPQTLADALAPHLLQGAFFGSQERPYSAAAKRAMDGAYEAARGLDCNYIGTEHLLLGLLEASDGVAGRVLRQTGLTARQVRALWQAFRREQAASSGEKE